MRSRSTRLLSALSQLLTSTRSQGCATHAQALQDSALPWLHRSTSNSPLLRTASLAHSKLPHGVSTDGALQGASLNGTRPLLLLTRGFSASSEAAAAPGARSTPPTTPRPPKQSTTKKAAAKQQQQQQQRAKARQATAPRSVAPHISSKYSRLDRLSAAQSERLDWLLQRCLPAPLATAPLGESSRPGPELGTRVVSYYTGGELPLEAAAERVRALAPSILPGAASRKQQQSQQQPQQQQQQQGGVQQQQQPKQAQVAGETFMAGDHAIVVLPLLPGVRPPAQQAATPGAAAAPAAPQPAGTGPGEAAAAAAAQGPENPPSVDAATHAITQAAPPPPPRPSSPSPSPPLHLHLPGPRPVVVHGRAVWQGPGRCTAVVLYKYGAVAFFNTPEEHQAAVLQALQQAQEAHRASAASAAGGLGGGAKVAADSSGGGGGNGGGDALAHVARTTREELTLALRHPLGSSPAQQQQQQQQSNRAGRAKPRENIITKAEDMYVLKDWDHKHLENVARTVAQSSAIHYLDAQSNLTLADYRRLLDQAKALHKADGELLDMGAARRTWHRVKSVFREDPRPRHEHGLEGLALDAQSLSYAVYTDLAALDRSYTAWESDRHSAVWEAMRSEFEVDDRVEMLNDRIEFIHRHCSELRDAIRSKDTRQAERTIIWLIGFEILLSIYGHFLLPLLTEWSAPSSGPPGNIK